MNKRNGGGVLAKALREMSERFVTITPAEALQRLSCCINHASGLSIGR